MLRRVELVSRETTWSLAHNAALALGINLGLRDRACARQCLMGGTISDGDRLTSFQISKARNRVGGRGDWGWFYDRMQLKWLRLRWAVITWFSR